MILNIFYRLNNRAIILSKSNFLLVVFRYSKISFTLIELIVVIAIIGVLAAILVPAMLGYVRKSKVSSANSAANSLQKAINTALVEIDEETEEAGRINEISYTHDESSVSLDITATSTSTSIDASNTYKKIANYMDKVSKLDFFAECKGGVCTAVACQQDGAKYVGTAPGGIVTVDTYEDYSDNISAAFVAAKTKAETQRAAKS